MIDANIAVLAGAAVTLIWMTAAYVAGRPRNTSQPRRQRAPKIVRS